MSKILLSLTYIAILFFSFLFLPKDILAANIITKITFPDPPNIFPDTKKVVIEVTSDENSFNPAADHSFLVWNVSKGERTCYSTDSLGGKLNITPNKISASWEPKGCMTEIGTYNFQVWPGRPIDKTNDNLIGNPKTFNFTIQQPGGQEPKLSPLQQTVLFGTKPTVLVSNARPKIKYSFWWEGSQWSFAATPTPTDSDIQNGLLSVLLNLDGGTFQAGKSNKICMEVGDYRSPVGVACRYSTLFTFSSIAPPLTLSCSVLPSITPTTTDDINLSITKATPGTTYRMNVSQDGNTYLDAKPQAVDGLGNLLIPIGSKLREGIYTINIYDHSTNKQLNQCNISFQVGTIDTSRRPEDICEKTPEKCSSAAGKTAIGCTGDKNNPGIATAIGCIHTNPTELVKDFMTFAVGIGGGLAFLMMLLGAFQMLTSAGNPETLKLGQDRLTNAVIGLLFIIFSILLLQIIGFDILKIPGFGR